MIKAVDEYFQSIQGSSSGQNLTTAYQRPIESNLGKHRPRPIIYAFVGLDDVSSDTTSDITLKPTLKLGLIISVH